jgi:Tfp pilus assembly PilM family ATPase
MSAPESPTALGAATGALGILGNIAGTAQSVSSYNSAGSAALSAAGYNIGVIDVNLNRQLDSIALELRSFNSRQKSQVASSGVSVTSKSALFIMNDSLAKFGKEVVLAKENAELQKTRELFVAKQQDKALSTQGTARTLQGIFGAAQGITSLLGALKGGRG